MAARKPTADSAQRKITVIFGYSLFVLTVAALIISTVIPYTTILMNPVVLHFNVVMIMFSFVAAAIVPILVAYIIGDKAARNKDKLTHHFDGILLGALAYALSLVISGIGYPAIAASNVLPTPWPIVVASIWPVVATIVVTALVSIGYHSRTRKTGESVLNYKPYQLVLFASLAIGVASSLFYAAQSLNPGVLLNLVVPFIFVAIGYTILKKSQPIKRVRLAFATIAAIFGYAAMLQTGQLFIYAGYDTVAMIVTTVAGLGVWAVYLMLMARTIKKTNAKKRK